MRVRPVHISFLKEARNALSYRHCSFHVINRPQPGRVLKYFMRLVSIGFAYGNAERGIKKEEVRSRMPEPNAENFQHLQNFKADPGDQFLR
jgi:hypothetical protein